MLTIKMLTVIMSTVNIFFLSPKNLRFDKAVDILTYKSRHFNMKVGIMITNLFFVDILFMLYVFCRHESRHYDVQ